MKRFFVIMAGVAALLGVPRANATVEIRLIDTVGGTTVGDTGWLSGGTCTASTANSCTFVGVVGNYSLNVSTGSASNTINPFLDLNSINSTTSSTPGTLVIETLNTGYTTSTPEFEFEVGGT